MHCVFILPPLPSHVRVAEAVAEALVRRGHRATMVHHADAAGLIASPLLGFAAAPGRGGPTAVELAALAGRARGPLGLLRLIRALAAATDALSRAAPDVVRALGADMVISDQMEPAGALVARSLDLPHISLAAAIPLEPDPAVPSSVLPFRYDPSPAGIARNRIAGRVADLLTRPIARTLAARSAAMGCGAARRPDELISPLATITQLSPGFDLPRSRPMPTLHHCGPLRAKCENRNVSPPALPPSFIFATFGTLLGDDPRLFARIAAACRRLGHPLVVAHGGRLSAAAAGRLDAAVVTDLLPLPAAFSGAVATVTHGGLNTTLDSLVAGVPVLALPLAFDQPGVAARLVHAGAGLAIHPRLATTARIEAALGRLLDDPDLRAGAARAGADLAGQGGAERAADVIEAVARTGRPFQSAEAA